MRLGCSTPKNCLKQFKDFEPKRFELGLGSTNFLSTQKSIIFFVVFICVTRSACLTFRKANALLFHVLLRISPNYYTLMEELISVFSFFYWLRGRWLTFFLSRDDMYDAIQPLHENINMKEFNRWQGMVFEHDNKT